MDAHGGVEIQILKDGSRAAWEERVLGIRRAGATMRRRIWHRPRRASPGYGRPRAQRSAAGVPLRSGQD
jgi:hypothetical protein